MEEGEHAGHARNQIDGCRRDSPGEHGSKRCAHSKADNEPVLGWMIHRRQGKVRNELRDWIQSGHSHPVYEKVWIGPRSGSDHRGGIISVDLSHGEAGLIIVAEAKQQNACNPGRVRTRFAIDGYSTRSPSPQSHAARGMRRFRTAAAKRPASTTARPATAQAKTRPVSDH